MTSLCGHRVDLDPGRTLGDLFGHRDGVTDQVGLGQQEHRSGTGVPRQRQQALDPAKVRRRIHGLDDGGHVDVGRQHLTT